MKIIDENYEEGQYRDKYERQEEIRTLQKELMSTAHFTTS